MLHLTGDHSKQEQQLVVLKKGQAVMQSLTELATKQGWQGGAIAGIGAIENIDLGYFKAAEKTYLHRQFDRGEYELVSFVGNFSLKNDQPFLHAHIVISDDDFRTYGGHLFEATVAVTAEFYYTPLGKMPKRQFNEAIGLDLICGF